MKKSEWTASEAEQYAERLAAALQSTIMTAEELQRGIFIFGRITAKQFAWTLKGRD